MRIKDLNIEWLGHACFRIVVDGKVIYTDPFKIKQQKVKADYVLITHEHYDHLSLEDLKKVVKDGTTIVATADCQSTLNRLKEKIDIKIAMPEAKFDFNIFSVECLPAYNTNKHFHQKIHAWVGYLIKTKDFCIYHAGDTDVIPEQRDLAKYSEKLIMLLPVGGTFTMDWKEAAELVKEIKPYLAIPMHYGKIVGDKQDALNFVSEVEKSGLKAIMLEEEK